MSRLLQPVSIVFFVFVTVLSACSDDPNDQSTHDLGSETVIADHGETQDDSSAAPDGEIRDTPAVLDSEDADDSTALDADDTLTSTDDATMTDVAPWEFHREDYALINGWILMDTDHDRLMSAIDRAADYGVNHIQFSHDLIMDVDDLIGDSADVTARVALLNEAIEKAHSHGIKTWFWAHEFSNTGFDVCYAPDSDVWKTRADAYRAGLEMVPDMDGVVLMFGSSSAPPWYTLCTCDWCVDGWPDELLPPPQDERISIITKTIGDVITKELERELITRVFIHETDENAWHADGLSAVKDLEFTAMHKSETQDWQPYNPPDPTLGETGPHPAILEFDSAGEYLGLSILPWCAPGYYRHRLAHGLSKNVIGVAVRIERGSNRALGTPNEVNILALSRLLKDPETPLESIWNEFIESRYELAPSAQSTTLAKILADTFPIARKSHYALGIWALEKSSNLPKDLSTDQFFDRGAMPKFDADYQGIWDSLRNPDETVIRALWQEGCESVVLAENSLTLFVTIARTLSEADALDLLSRLSHQYLAARAWQAYDLFQWTRKAQSQGDSNALYPGYMSWAVEELKSVRQGIIDAGLANAEIVNKSTLDDLLSTLEPLVADVPVAVRPAFPTLSPVETVVVTHDQATIAFSCSATASFVVDFGEDIPDYGRRVEIPQTPAGQRVEVLLEDLIPGARTVVRIRADTTDGQSIVGGDFWIFLDFQGDN